MRRLIFAGLILLTMTACAAPAATPEATATADLFAIARDPSRPGCQPAACGPGITLDQEEAGGDQRGPQGEGQHENGPRDDDRDDDRGQGAQGGRPGGDPSGSGSSAGDSGITVTNPSSGAELSVQVFNPPDISQPPYPAVVLVPGGNSDSSLFTDRQRGIAQGIADAGWVVVVFDPDGRGASGGEEDYGGFIQQDGLAAVMSYAAALPHVDATSLGIATNSYGVTLAAGALARHPEMPAVFLLDWEGPADRDDTGGCGGAQGGHLREVAACDDEAFWAEREAVTFISQIRVPYIRIQSQTDHVQADYAHTVAMINAAVAGGVPYVRLNDLEPNQSYRLDAMPAMLPDAIDRALDELYVEYMNDLLEVVHGS